MSNQIKFKKVDQSPNFATLEESLLRYWYESGVVEDYLSRNDKSDQRFSFIDGPITANNPMGVHHAWGRTYKDLWQRYYNMRGYKQRFQNGFDCQGLWVEVEVEKELGFKSKKDIEKYGIDKFVEACKERVRKYSGIQTEQTKRLGNFMDWANSYFTMSDENNYMIWTFLKKVHEDGRLYKGRDSVPWCPRCGTAISQHEIETESYKEMTHSSVFVQYPIKGRNKEFLMIWTTTPWTLPINAAVAVNPIFTYLKIEQAGQILYVGKDRVDILKPDYKVLDELSGSQLVGWEYDGPYDDLPTVKKQLGNYQHRVIAAPDLVSAEEGTALVHIAPGAGKEDFNLGKAENIPVIDGVDETGFYYEGFGAFSAQTATDNPNLIIDDLAKRDFIYDTLLYTHRYPRCWRCKTDLIWRVVDEWYISMDSLRDKITANAKQINWQPDFALDRELDWLKNMQDWLISKKRYWGLALPIYECPKCEDFEVIGSAEELKKRAVEGWDQFSGHSPHRPWVDNVKIKCPKCNEIVSRIKDVGNPWLDAGIVPFSTLHYRTDKEYWKKWYPADFVTESFPGQFKNWFYSLLTMATVLEDSPSFKNILGYGLLKDENREEMHKSKGNSIEFNSAASQVGADPMRWVFSKANPENNLNFGFHIIENSRKNFFLILWNVYKFFTDYALMDSYQPEKVESSNVLDRWLTSRWNETLKEVDDSLQNYDNLHAATALEKFVQDLSTWWLRRSRDRMGPWVENQEDKRAAYWTLYNTLTNLTKTLAPFIPFFSDEIYRNLTSERSVHLANWPKTGLVDHTLIADMQLAREFVELAHSSRKEKSFKLRQPLASLIYTSETKLPQEIETILAAELNVKSVNFQEGKELKATLDFNLTEELNAEGVARELIRKIQDERKKLGLDRQSRIIVTVPDFPDNWETEIKKSVLADILTKGSGLKVEPVS
jgi:isoleucyl-tRNA synthetase